MPAKTDFEDTFLNFAEGQNQKVWVRWTALETSFQTPSRKRGVIILVSEIFQISNFAKIDTFSVFAPEGAVRLGLQSGVYEVKADTLTRILYISLFYFDPLKPRTRHLKF